MKPWRVLALTILFAGVLYFLTNLPRSVSRKAEPSSASSETGVTRPEHVELAQASGPQPLDTEEQLNVTVYKKALPSVVNITSTAVAFDFFYGPVPQQGAGSGFVIDGEGHILTNYHVIENARQVEVTTSDKKKYKAQIVGTDPAHDLAVIQIPAKGVPKAEIGDSKNLVVGQKVFAIGNPFGLSGTMTRGIISSIRSVRGPRGFIDEAIQTDAAINPGNSGGPLLNSRGQVIGINSMILTGGVEQSAGIGFAIPINTAKSVLDDLVHLGHPRYPSLGVRRVWSLVDHPEVAETLQLNTKGLMVVDLYSNSPADKAGIHESTQLIGRGFRQLPVGGDVILEIQGKAVNSVEELQTEIARYKPGDKVDVTVLRANKKVNIPVTLEEAPRR